MDSFTPEEPPPASSSNGVAWLVFAASASLVVVSRRSPAENNSFPMVYTQDTERNNAICSLMTAALLRRTEKKKHFGRRKRRRQIREPLQLTKAKQVQVNWYLPEGISNQDNLHTPSTHTPVILIVRDESVSSIKPILVEQICQCAVQRGLIVSEVAFQCDDSSWDDFMRQVLRHVVSKLAPETPLFLVVGEEATTDAMLSSNSKEYGGRVLGLVVIASSPSSMGAISFASLNDMGAPILFLNLCNDSTSMKTWRNNPNAVVVQLSGGESVSKDSRAARCVVDYADAVTRLQNSLDGISNYPRARL